MTQAVMLLAVEGKAPELRVFRLQLVLQVWRQRLGTGQGMAGAPRLTAETDLDLPGQIHQLLTVALTADRRRNQQLPARFRRGHPQLGAALPVANQLAVVVAAFWHPELPFVHGGRQQDRPDGGRQQQEQLQAPTTPRSFSVTDWLHRTA